MSADKIRVVVQKTTEREGVLMPPAYGVQDGEKSTTYTRLARYNSGLRLTAIVETENGYAFTTQPFDVEDQRVPEALLGRGIYHSSQKEFGDAYKRMLEHLEGARFG